MVLDIAGHTLDSATSLNLSGTNQLFTDSLTPLYNTDYWKFQLSSASNFNLTLNGLSQDVNVELLDTSGAVIKGSYNTGSLAETINQNLNPGNYYLGVRLNNNTTSTAYNLNLSAPVNPLVNITATDATAGETLTTETADLGKFTLTRTGDITSALTVNYTVDGTAIDFTDYNTLNGSATFAAGTATTIIDITPVDDSEFEGIETVGVSLISSANYNLGTNNFATLNIADNDKPTITVSTKDVTAGETLSTQTANPGQFSISRGGNTALPLTVNYTVAGTGINGTDYIKLNGTATFAGGSATTIINVLPIDDTISEANETVVLTLAAGTTYNLGTAKTATVNIADNDIPVITIAATDTSAGETLTTQTANPGRFTLTRIGNLASALTVNYTVAGTGINGTDYTSLPGSVTFAAGAATTFVDITPIDDSEFEGSETVVVNLATGSNYNIGTVNSATVTITENDKPTVTVIANDNTAGETLTTATANPGQFTLSRSGNTLAPLTVNYTLTGTATNGTDYSNLTGSVTFAAGYATTTINVTPIDDTVSEGNESVVLTLVTGTNYNLGTGNTATVTIVDNDLPTITINANDGNAGETLTGQIANPGQFTLTRIGSTASSLTVNYTVSGTAINGTDYNTLTNSVTFAAGSSTALINVNPINDAAFEGNETVIVTLASSANYVLGTAKSGTVTIADNDAAPLITVASPNGGESLVIGSNYNLTWVDNIAENVKIDLYKGGVYNRTIFSPTLSDGSENWLLPADLVSGLDYSIKITSVNNGNVSDLSNSNFSIIPNHTGLITDFNKDGKTDILWKNLSSGEFGGWAMNGTTGSWIDLDDGGDKNDGAWYFVGTGDFNNDGNTDIIQRYHWVNSPGYVRIWLMNGNQRIDIKEIEAINSNDWHIAGTGDFNQDGNVDILLRNYVTGSNHVWMMQNYQVIGRVDLEADTNLNQRVVGTGDFNGDGKSDILWRNAVTGWNSIWYMNNTTVSSKGTVDIVTDLNWHIMGAADFNNDGKSDIIWRNNANGQNVVWLMNGNTHTGDLDIDDVSDRTWNIVGDSDQIPIWTADYFGNKDLTGSPTYTEGFINITGNFSRDWGTGSPPNTPVDNFSARYKTQQYLAPGLYKVNLGSDDGVRVWIGNELIINQWTDQVVITSDYFTSSGGYYPVTIEYKENGGNAWLNYEIVKYQPYDTFGDGVGLINSWNATFFHWNGQGNPIMDDAHKIGTVKLTGNTRGDGQWGMNFQNWGAGSPAPGVPVDNFAMHAYTRAGLTAGRTYEVWVRSDDGYQVFAHKLGGGAFNITPNALNGEWQPGAYGNAVKWTFVAPESGTFDFKINMFEGGGDAYVDLVLKDVTVVTPPPPVWENPLVPGSYVVTQEYSGPTFYSNHTGIDLGSKGSVIGGRVEAVRNGTVIRAGWDTTGYGNLVVVDHGDGLKSYYAHLNSISVGVGQQVNINTQVGTLGTTGNSTGPHLHLEVRLNNVPQNPRNYISGL
jgi:hypothetical protein